MPATVKFTEEPIDVEVPVTEIDVLHQTEVTLFIMNGKKIFLGVDFLTPLSIQLDVLVGFDHITAAISGSLAVGFLRPEDRFAAFEIFRTTLVGEFGKLQIECPVALCLGLLAVGKEGMLLARAVVLVKRNVDRPGQLLRVGVYYLQGVIAHDAVIVHHTVTAVEHRQAVRPDGLPPYGVVALGAIQLIAYLATAERRLRIGQVVEDKVLLGRIAAATCHRTVLSTVHLVVVGIAKLDA